MNKYNEFNNMCPFANKIKLGDILNKLDEDLTSNTPYTGEKLTDDEIKKLNSMCGGAEKAKLGEVLGKIIEASKDETNVSELTEDEEKNLSNMGCPVCEKNNILNIVKDFISKVNKNVPSSDATLKTLTISEGTLEPEFNKNTISYTATVPFSVSNLTVNAEATDSKASVEGDGEKELTVGSNQIDVTCTAEDSTEKTYTITVEREKNSDATLKSLEVAGQTMNPTFDKNTTSYTVNVANSVSNVTINAAATDSNASVQGTGNKTVNVGTNNFDVDVTAQNGTTTKKYTITISRPKNNNAKLSTLSVEGQSIVPEFNADTLNYTLTVDNAVESINILATAEDTKANVSGTGNKQLSVGQNTCNVKVTAEDGETTKTYVITVTRSEAA